MLDLSSAADTSDHSSGPADAAVTLLQYCDFQCPDCADVYPDVKQLQRRMGNDLRIVFRHFPLVDIHPFAMFGAQTAEAAALQGKFWEVHDLLFENQFLLSSPPKLYAQLQKLGLDVPRLRLAAEGGEVDQVIEQDRQSGLQSGVHGTPAFFINGKHHKGDGYLSDLLPAVQAVLRSAK